MFHSSMSKILSPPQLSQCHSNRVQPEGIAGLRVVTVPGFLCDINLIPFAVPQNESSTKISDARSLCMGLIALVIIASTKSRPTTAATSCGGNPAGQGTEARHFVCRNAHERPSPAIDMLLLAGIQTAIGAGSVRPQSFGVCWA